MKIYDYFFIFNYYHLSVALNFFEIVTIYVLLGCQFACGFVIFLLGYGMMRHFSCSLF